MFRTLLKSLRENKKNAVLTPLLVSCEVVIECIIPMVIAKLVNNFGTLDIWGILGYGAIVAVLAIMSLAFGTAAGITCATASCGFARNLRRDIYYAVQDYSFENIDKFSTSSLVTRMTTDVANVQNAFMMLIRTAIRSPLMLIFSIVMSFAISPTLPAVFFVTVPILAFGIIIITKKAMPVFKRVFKKYDNLNNSIQENIKGMRVVKAYVREDYESEKFKNVSGELSKDFIKAEKILAFNGPLMQFCLQGALVVIAFIGSSIILGLTSNTENLSIFSLQSMLTYSLQILISLIVHH